MGVEEFGNPDPFHIKPKAHVEEEEMSEDEWRRSKLPRDVVEDNPVLGKDHGRRKRHTTKGSLLEHPKGKHKYDESAMGV